METRSPGSQEQLENVDRAEVSEQPLTEQQIDEQVRQFSAEIESDSAKFLTESKAATAVIGEQVQSECPELSEEFKTLIIELENIDGTEVSIANDCNNELKSLVEGEKVATPEGTDTVETQISNLKSLFEGRNNYQSLVEVATQINSSGEQAGLKGAEFRLVANAEGAIAYINSSGEVVVEEINPDNAKDILINIKKSDEAIKGDSYELRTMLLSLSKGRVSTSEAYTYPVLDEMGSEIWGTLSDPDSWVQERRELHQSLSEKALQDAQDLSDRLGDEKPTVYCLRGNTAAGKTTMTRTEPVFSRAIDQETGEITGAINPDTIKYQLMEADVQDEHPTTNHAQSHMEGSGISWDASEEIVAKEGLSLVVDKRLAKESDFESIISASEKNNKAVRLMDIECPLETSLLRVLGRKPGGDGPLLSFDNIAEGFTDIRKDRKAILQKVAESQSVEAYVLYCTDENGKSVKAAEKVDGKMIILDEKLLVGSMDTENIQESVDALASNIIDDSYIDNARSLGVSEQTIATLQQYKGVTLKEALDNHSLKV